MRAPRFALLICLAASLARAEHDPAKKKAPGPEAGAPPNAPAVMPEPPAICRHADLAELNATIYDAQPAKRFTKDYLRGKSLGVTSAAFPVSASASEAALLFDDKKQNLVIVFRGSRDSNDWLANLNDAHQSHAFKAKDGSLVSAQVHEGFYQLAQEYRPLVEAVESVRKAAKKKGLPPPKVTISGLSLGGALSQLVSEMLAQAGMPPDEVVIFGSPGVGDGDFDQVYESYDLHAVHYQFPDDPVTALPPGLHRAPVAVEKLPPPRLSPPQTLPSTRNRALDLGIRILADNLQQGAKKTANDIESHNPDAYMKAMRERCDEHPSTWRRKIIEAYQRLFGRHPKQGEVDGWVVEAKQEGIDKALARIEGSPEPKQP